VFPVRYGQTYRFEFQIKDRTMDNVENCDSYINMPSSVGERIRTLQSE
jgi:hypothetical protein